MLGYLEELCTALMARESQEIRRLLRHPLARALPRRVREEGLAIARAGKESLRAPVQTLHFYHQTMHLLVGSAARNAEQRRGAEIPGDEATHRPQLDLPLAANDE